MAHNSGISDSDHSLLESPVSMFVAENCTIPGEIFEEPLMVLATQICSQESWCLFLKNVYYYLTGIKINRTVIHWIFNSDSLLQKVMTSMLNYAANNLETMSVM